MPADLPPPGPGGGQPPPRREDTQPIPLPAPPGEPPAAGAAIDEGFEDPPPQPPPARVAAIVLGVAVLALLGLVILNVVVARNAESRASEEASAALGSPADVRLRGFPVGLRLLLNAPVDATMLAREVPLEGTAALLTRLEVEASDVTIERGGDGAVRAERATFVAELDDAAVQQMIGILGRIPLTDVELANGVARLSIAGFALVDATADVEGGQVVFRVAAPIGNLANVRLELDDLPLGFQVESVEIRPGLLRLRGWATDLRLEGRP